LNAAPPVIRTIDLPTIPLLEFVVTQSTPKAFAAFSDNPDSSTINDQTNRRVSISSSATVHHGFRQ
jgi:hypothetical protein